LGTEAGVSRFDGTHFKNFTTKDGLPDLEILQIFSDSKGRVWMAPFRKSICYYYKGAIHNQQNDTLLRRIQLQGNIDGFAEDAHGNILLHELNRMHIIRADNSLVQYDSLDHQPIRYCIVVNRSAGGHFVGYANNKVIEFSCSKTIRSTDLPMTLFHRPYSNHMAIQAAGIVWRDTISYNLLTFFKQRIILRPVYTRQDKHISFTFLDDSLIYINQTTGSSEYNINTGKTTTYLPGIAVTRVYRDVAGNLWFTTKGKGIFRLNSQEWKIIGNAIDNVEKSNVTALARVGNELWVGDNHHCIARYALPGMKLISHKPHYFCINARILYIDTMPGDIILSGGDFLIDASTHNGDFLRTNPGNIKSAMRINNQKLLFACNWGAGLLDLQTFKIQDTLWRERTTIVFHKEDTIYIGTMNGLYRSVKSQPFVFLGEQTPFLSKRIVAMAASPDGTIWIASGDDAGIIGYKNSRQITSIGRQQGLTSDICRNLLVHNNVLWVGTDKGLNRIQLNTPGYPVTKYTSKDGLVSDMINTLFADGSTIYVGTPDGLSYFDESKIGYKEDCRLQLLSLINSERDRIADTAHLVIPYTDKRVRFEFAGISYRSAGDITYRYRLAGLDDTWRETKDNFLEYPELPAGDYEWQLMAINKFGNKSRLLRVPMTVTIQFWKTTWFAVIVYIASFGLLWWLIVRRYKRRQRQQEEKDKLMQQMNELENTALKSQMDPHFIFNCLNSIQQFIFSGNLDQSNKYIAGLAKLIRTTLNNSSQSFVSVRDEVDYLSSYLFLEKMRFKEKIDYELVVDPAIDQSAVLIPPMLIQPFAENALQHGLPDKATGKGFIRINMRMDKDQLIVTVEDNGIGRQAAAEKKKNKITIYPSKGMSLVEDRMRIINKLYHAKTSIEIEDLANQTGNPTGTRITIRLPFRDYSSGD
jgi:ligand-binding sensor domain-containing protein/two-component sensor histidine kinase